MTLPSRTSTGLLSLAPVGWAIPATCGWCGFMRTCFGDGEHWFCSSCFNDFHGFDPRICEWGPADV